MSRRLRFLLLWLIALALPVQGFAAATMLHCAPVHHGAAMPAADAASPHHDHAAHMKHAAAEKPTQASGCSACASCCLGAGFAMPMAIVDLVLLKTAALPPPDETAWVGPPRAAPERPPRLARV